MNIFFVKRFIWSGNGMTLVTDGTGKPVYQIIGSAWRQPSTLNDIHGKPICLIEQPSTSSLVHTAQMTDGRTMSLQPFFTLGPPKYELTGLDVTVVGKVWSSDCQIFQQGQLLATVTYQDFQTSYMVSMAETDLQDQLMAIILMMDKIHRCEFSIVAILLAVFVILLQIF